MLSRCFEYTPPYCRITRVIRDIPSTEISDGNTTTNLREVVENKLQIENRRNVNIRAREVRNKPIKLDELKLDEIFYKTNSSDEYFLQYINNNYQIAGFLRLSLPIAIKNQISPELDECAIIREVHIYGPSLELEDKKIGAAQHTGLGTKLIERAKVIARDRGFKKLAVIHAVGTKEYYKKRGFSVEGDWLVCKLKKTNV
ncbi:GNAT family N-acetyltransferase [Candidatus Dojkabacteria bacterium]|uniref:GNAT family N-acetyltransferase n=1 Tax=Candidatus Dojkabacteria bacterium TaxID=2099670 RepID=A0A3M0YZB6_9BACT|nr:MAG: GNAT family N-acetyltransferase [Candidatus Dojkabacteria bacterium]